MSSGDFESDFHFLDPWPTSDLRALRGRVGEVLQERIDRILAQREEGVATSRRGRMNKTEAAYRDYLSAEDPEARVLFEAIKLRLADGAWYTPDFLVIRAEAVPMECHEVKGFWREAARVRIKVAARLFPFFAFRSVQKRRVKDGGGWKVEEFTATDRGE